MPGCLVGCPEVTAADLYGQWHQIRSSYGPKPELMTSAQETEIFNEDVAAWTAATGGAGASFANWLRWKLRTGTDNYGNLGTRLRDHEGLRAAPCPYDYKSSYPQWPSTDVVSYRAETMLGYVPTQNDHGIYYMKIDLNGTAWGFTCTYDLCPYYVANGRRYFYA